jgi:hypothetical protein
MTSIPFQNEPEGRMGGVKGGGKIENHFWEKYNFRS